EIRRGPLSAASLAQLSWFAREFGAPLALVYDGVRLLGLDGKVHDLPVPPELSASPSAPNTASPASDQVAVLRIATAQDLAGALGAGETRVVALDHTVPLGGQNFPQADELRNLVTLDGVAARDLARWDAGAVILAIAAASPGVKRAVALCPAGF